MRNTKWMVICLLIGFVMATAMTSTIPIYMNASLQRMLIKDMQAYQDENNEYPGVYAVSKTIISGTNAPRAEHYRKHRLPQRDRTLQLAADSDAQPQVLYL